MRGLSRRPASESSIRLKSGSTVLGFGFRIFDIAIVHQLCVSLNPSFCQDLASNLTCAANGFCSGGSSSAETASTAWSNREMRLGNASLKPEIRRVTSTLGRARLRSGKTSKSITRRLGPSQTGRTPRSASASDISSPPVAWRRCPTSRGQGYADIRRFLGCSFRLGFRRLYARHPRRSR